MMKLHDLKDRSKENLERVKNLVKIYKSLVNNEKKHDKHDTDLLRAAVVLLHATLEDFVRVLVGWKLPHASSDQIKKSDLRVPLHKLADNKESTVGDFLIQSLEEVLSRSTYNNKDDVTKALKSIGLDTINLKTSDLETAMTRRHKIVHRGDRGGEAEAGKVNPIQANHVLKWIENVEVFISDVSKQLEVQELPQNDEDTVST
ncbi:HEPN domain-containing protein [Desulfuromonas thiophila]|uniref:HEPN domain-containing protein n=1 Tax=Desulfuromonas thiophila TaxID=57664 RepID=UPI0024A7FBC3|nr:HEPN domain-containing protein [Desulfuromonas thiophila]